MKKQARGAQPKIEPGYLTVAELADFVDRTPAVVRKHCVEGKLRGAKQVGDGRAAFFIVPEKFADRVVYEKAVGKPRGRTGAAKAAESEPEPEPEPLATRARRRRKPDQEAAVPAMRVGSHKAPAKDGYGRPVRWPV